MNRVSRIAATAAVLAGEALASAHGVSPQSETLETAAEAVRDSVAADAAKTRSAKRVLALLSRKTNARSLASELASVRDAARLAEAKLPGLLTAALTDAADAYAQDLASTRELLALAADSTVPPRGLRRRWKASLAKFDRALPAEPATDVLTTRIAQLAAAAAAGRGFTPYDQGQTYDWVLSSLALAPAGQGADLDGDRTPDNAVGGLRGLASLLGLDLDALFVDILAPDGTFALVEMWSVQKLAGDSFVLAGFLSATDGDADPSNDFSGSGVFAVAPDALDASGHPAARVVTTCSKRGAYTIDLTGQGVSLPGFALPASARVIVEGKATAASTTGTIGVAIPLDVLFAAIEAGGTPLSDSAKAQLRNFADLDTDPATPGKESISAAFTFAAVAAQKVVGGT